MCFLQRLKTAKTQDEELESLATGTGRTVILKRFGKLQHSFYFRSVAIEMLSPQK
jgi:uncharacterized cysteine cluster protein YcgN (CxxCxxCC family)